MNQRLPSSVNAVISSGASLSNALDTYGARDLAIQMPPAWDAANVTFAASDAVDGTYNPVFDDAGTEVSVTAAAGHFIVIGTATKQALGAAQFIRLRSGTAASPVNQSGDRTIVVVLK